MNGTEPSLRRSGARPGVGAAVAWKLLATTLPGVKRMSGVVNCALLKATATKIVQEYKLLLSTI